MVIIKNSAMRVNYESIFYEQERLGIALVLLMLLTVGVVFAQVCLTNDTANVTPSGRTVLVRNKMNNQPINVELHFTRSASRGGNGSVETGAIDAFGTKTVTLPEYSTYSSYTVWSCY
jgi:hypothetical protein